MPKYAEFQAFREQNFITEADGDMLHREARALAIRRIEESARTEADFENVLYWWDKLDANREQKEREHEIGRSTVPLEWGADEMYLSDRPSYDMILRRLLLAGEFIDIIFDHPETIHELVTDADLSGILKDLKPHLKNMLYYLFMRDYSAAEYAESIVYLPKNHFIKAETLSTEEYLSYFYPFDKPDFRKNGVESGWSVTDREGIAITMAMGNAPQAVTMESQKEYAERYDWLVKEFTDWAFTFMTSFLYYMDYDTIDEQTRSLYRQGISAFGGISPTYRIALEKIHPLSYGTSIPCLSWCRCAFLSCSRIRTVTCVCANTVKKPLSQAGKEMNFAARNVKISLMSTNQEKRKRGTIKMIENRNVNIITDADGKKLVLINDIRFKAKVRDDWTAIEEYLKEYIGDFYEIEETSEKIYISSDFPDEYASSESRIALKGAVAKAKANVAQAIPELIRIAANPKHEVNRKEKHKTDAMYGWYRYDIRFALPVYDDKTGKIARHNIYSASMLVRHADNGQKYLYDILAIRKETSSPLE